MTRRGLQELVLMSALQSSEDSSSVKIDERIIANALIESGTQHTWTNSRLLVNLSLGYLALDGRQVYEKPVLRPLAKDTVDLNRSMKALLVRVRFHRLQTKP